MKFLTLAAIALSAVFVTAENEPLCLEQCVLNVCDGLANATCWCIINNMNIASCVAANCSASDKPKAVAANDTICGCMTPLFACD
jgi:hypothetical protein